MANDNIDRLRRAGFRIDPELHQRYKKVIEGLDEDAMKVLIDTKESLDKVQREHLPGQPWQERFVPY